MHIQQPVNYIEKFKDDIVTFSPYTIKKTSLVLGHTVLKIDEYNLVCTPYQATMRNIVVLLPLKREEVSFFSRFLTTYASISIIFEPPGDTKQLKLFSRCVLQNISLMQSRDNVGLITLEFKPIPQDLINIIGNFLSMQERLKSEYTEFQTEVIKITPENSKLLGYNNYALLQIQNVQYKLAIFSISSSNIDILLPPATEDIPIGSQGSIKLFFKLYQFSVTCTIKSWNRLPTGVARSILTLDFSPELLEIIENYHFEIRMIQKRNESAKPTP